MPTKRRTYAALIADMVGSRSHRGAARATLQLRFSELVDDLNARYAKQIASQFVVTTGDEFQGLLSDAAAIPGIVWDIDAFPYAELRVGIGHGVLDTPLRDVALNMDGPVFHRARQAIESSRERRWLGGVFVGFGEREDLVLNGFARLLARHRQRLSRQQRRSIALLRQGLTQTATAQELGLTKQAISSYARHGGWDEMRAGEIGWENALRLFQASSRGRGT